MRQLPPLRALRAFESAARHGNFTTAARELNVTQGAVSQQVILLEARLGVRLFDRTRRGVRLTDTGRRYERSLEQIFDALAKATDEIAAAVPGSLRISVLPTIATRWLVPRLARFSAANPDIDVELTISLRDADFADNTIDAAIRHGRAPWAGLTAHLLAAQMLGPVCNPMVAVGSHPLRRPADLKHHTLLHVTREADEWSSWLRAAGIHDIDPTRGLRFDSTRMALDAAAEGLGVALGREPFVADELHDGRLIAPFDVSLPSKSAYYFVYPEDISRKRCFPVFRDWLLEEAQARWPDQTASGQENVRV